MPNLSEPSPSDTPPISLRDRAMLRWLRITNRINVSIAALYLAAASLIGVEGMAMILAFSSVLPITIPVVIAVLALIAVFRQRLGRLWHRLRSSAGDR